ncbi:MAG: MCE family protein [Planctomycetes bacterium]|nr:MCE family protein [Planctomycetota bacterium]
MRWFRHLLGLATLVATCVAGHYLWSLARSEDSPAGYDVTLLFENTDGLRVGAGIRYRGVRVGEVRRIRLGTGGRTVEVRCLLDPDAQATVRTSSRFWIVRPRFRGLVEGASGLDTLIKDSYLTYDTPAGDFPSLPTGSRLPGLEKPPETSPLNSLPEPRAGDLSLSVVFAENRGLKAGGAVAYRGQRVGDVRRVRLSEDGTGVRVDAVVAREFRSTVRSGSRFWIARPSVRASWSGGLEVHDIENLISGPSLTYAPPEDEQSSPASDASVFVGLDERPAFEWEAPRPTSSPDPTPTPSAEDPRLAALTRVHYRFIEVDYWSPNDENHFESAGVAFITHDGVPAVLIARTSVDGNWLVTEPLSTPEVRDESWSVTLSDGSVHGAGRVWLADADGDLALLRLDGRARTAIEAMSGAHLAYPELDDLKSAAIEAIGLEPNGSTVVRRAGTLADNGEIRGPAAELVRPLILHDGRFIGVGSKRSDVTRISLFSQLPESLRGRRP